MAAAWKANQAGRLHEAQELCRRALKVNPRDPSPRLALAMISYQMADYVEAWKQIDPILESKVDFPPALPWASAISLALGDFASAAEFAVAAAKRVSDNPEAHSLAGRAFLALGQFERAVNAFQTAAALRPKEAAHYYGAGAALTGLKRKEAAVEALRTAIALSPELEGLSNLAELEVELGYFDEALKHCELGLRIDGDDPKLQTAMAVALTQLNRTEEAEGHWASAKAHANPADVLNRQGHTLLSMGLFDAGIEALNEAIRLEPNNWLPYSAIISAKRVTESDRPLIESLERLALSSSTTPNEVSQIQYALGKASDNLGDFEAAMSHYDEAHRLVREFEPLYKPFDVEEMRGEVDAKIQVFTKELLKNPSFQGSQSTMPIFVVGMMRSGTTLVEQILTCHRQVGGAGEQSFWLDAEPRVSPHLQIHSDGRVLKQLAESYCALLARLAPGCDHVVEKNPGNCMLAGLLHLALPNSRIIHTIRTPVDNALSIWSTPMETVAGFIHRKEDIVASYREYARLAEHWRCIIPKERFLEVRYEDLVSDGERTTRRMLEFCGLDWDPACMHPELNQRSVKTPSFWQVRQPINTGSVEKWRRYEPWLGAFRELLP